MILFFVHLVYFSPVSFFPQHQTQPRSCPATEHLPHCLLCRRRLCSLLSQARSSSYTFFHFVPAPVQTPAFSSRTHAFAERLLTVSLAVSTDCLSSVTDATAAPAPAARTIRPSSPALPTRSGPATTTTLATPRRRRQSSGRCRSDSAWLAISATLYVYPRPCGGQYCQKNTH